MKKAAILALIAVVVITSFYIGRHCGYEDGVIDATADHLVSKITYL
jgi:hypothetical protein